MPKETHEHYDADGKYTGKTIVTRESEWDDYTRSRVMALVAYESQLCPSCKSFGTLEPVDEPAFPVRWDKYDGRRIEVKKFRCLACASSSAVQRWWAEEQSKKQGDAKLPAGQVAPGDGLMFAATPLFEE